jgi:mRNA-degrading endonuclease RelE of RelBE toxin-antitoxin system
VRLVVSSIAAETIRHLSPTVKRGIRQALRSIELDPACGEPLQRELAGYFKFKVRRFRVIYAIDRVRGIVTVVAAGQRSTIYEEVAEQLRARPSLRGRR